MGSRTYKPARASSPPRSPSASSKKRWRRRARCSRPSRWPRTCEMTVAVVDNYDSFTYNLVQYLGELGPELRVFRNDEVTVQELGAFDGIVISPGPGTPDDAGVSNEAIRNLSGKVPILGVCLGHQCLGQVFGGNVIRNAPSHGKRSWIRHD